MRLFRLMAAIAAFFVVLPHTAYAQGVTRLCQQSVNATTGANNCPDVGPSYPLNITSAPAAAAAVNNASSTITSTGVFQTVFAANASRLACTIQNNGTHNMNLFINNGTASLTNSVVLTPGNSAYCNVGNTILPFAVQLTGTAGDAFYAQAE